VTAADVSDSTDTDIVMLASLQAVSDALQVDQVSVGLMQRVVVNDRSVQQVEQAAEQQTPQQPVDRLEATSPAAKTVAAVASDDVMAAWDETIWAEESAQPVSVAATQAPVAKAAKASNSWLTGLAMISTSLFKRRQHKNDE